MSKQMREHAEGLLLSTRLKADPGELRALMQRPDGLPSLVYALGNMESSKQICDMILADLGSIPAAWRVQIGDGYSNLINSQNAEEWFKADLIAAGFSKEQANGVRINAISEALQDNPEQSLRWMAEVDLTDDQRESLIRNLFSSRRDAQRIDELMAMLGSDEERTFANEQLEAYGMGTGTRAEIKAATPEEWFDAVQASPNRDSDTFTSLLGEWTPEQQAEFARQFKDLGGEKKRAAAVVLAADAQYGYDEGSQELTAEALRYLLSPVPGAVDAADVSGQVSNYPYTAASFAVHWSTRDPEGASGWVQSLPEGKGKLWVQKNLALNWAKYDPEATTAWLGTMPAATRTDIEDFMKNPRSQQQ
jgi:hypothetical protein